jgi:hypothetical protein
VNLAGLEVLMGFGNRRSQINNSDFPFAKPARGVTTKSKAWEITVEFWSCVEPMIRVHQRIADQTKARNSCGGRKCKARRMVAAFPMHDHWD